MYGSESGGNWDLLDGTLESLMQNSDDDEAGHQITGHHQQSPEGDESCCWSMQGERCQINILASKLTAAFSELEADHMNCRSSIALCSREIELVESRSSHWMNRLIALQESITSIQLNSSTTTVPLYYQQQQQQNNNLQSGAVSKSAASDEGKDIDRYDGDDRRLLASFQDPSSDDNSSDILNRIDLLKKHLVVSADNKAGSSSGSQHGAKLVPPTSSQVEMTSPAAAMFHKRPATSSSFWSSKEGEQFQNSSVVSSTRTPQYQ